MLNVIYPDFLYLRIIASNIRNVCFSNSNHVKNLASYTMEYLLSPEDEARESARDTSPSFNSQIV